MTCDLWHALRKTVTVRHRTRAVVEMEEKANICQNPSCHKTFTSQRRYLRLLEKHAVRFYTLCDACGQRDSKFCNDKVKAGAILLDKANNIPQRLACTKAPLGGWEIPTKLCKEAKLQVLFGNPASHIVSESASATLDLSEVEDVSDALRTACSCLRDPNSNVASPGGSSLRVSKTGAGSFEFWIEVLPQDVGNLQNLAVAVTLDNVVRHLRSLHGMSLAGFCLLPA